MIPILKKLTAEKKLSEYVVQDAGNNPQVTILRMTDGLFNSRRVYLEAPPYHQPIVFGQRNGFNKCPYKDTMITLPLPWTYYALEVNEGGGRYGRFQLGAYIVTCSPYRLRKWNKQSPGFALPLPNMGRGGTVCSPSQPIYPQPPDSKRLDPLVLLSNFWSSKFSIYEYECETHDALAMWGGCDAPVSYSYPDLKQYDKWAELNLEDLPNQDWLWESPLMKSGNIYTYWQSLLG